MIISIDLDAKAYLRYWNFALTSKTSSNRCFDRFPSKFSTFWTIFQKIERHCSSSSLFLVKCSFPRGRIFFFHLLWNLSKHRFDDVFEVSAKFQYRRWGLASRFLEIIIETLQKQKNIKTSGLKKWALFFLCIDPGPLVQALWSWPFGPGPLIQAL